MEKEEWKACLHLLNLFLNKTFPATKRIFLLPLIKSHLELGSFLLCISKRFKFFIMVDFVSHLLPYGALGIFLRREIVLTLLLFPQA